MRDDEGQIWCDTKTHRPTRAESLLSCMVEGREHAMCGVCRKAWLERVRDHPDLAMRCPNCAQMATSQKAPAPEDAVAPLTGPLAAAIEDAMFRAGILIDQRTRVLKMLAGTTDPYVGSLLRSTAGVS